MRSKKTNETNSKKVLSILLAGVMLLSIFTAMVPAVSAQYQNDHNLILAGQTDNRVIRGQILKFETANLSENIYKIDGSNVVLMGSAPAATTTAYDSMLLDAGYTYFLDNDDSGTYTGSETKFSVEALQLSFKLKVGTTEVTTVTRDTNITLDITTNMDTANDTVHLMVIDPDNNQKTVDGNGNSLADVSLATLEANDLNTTGWNLGLYTIHIKTNASVSQGLDDETSSKQLEIIAPELTVSVTKDDVTVGETTTLTVQGPASDAVNVISSKANGEFVGGYYQQVNDADIETTQSAATNTSLGEDSTYKVVIKFSAKGTYKLTVNDVTDTTVAEKTVTIRVEEGQLSLDVPSSASVGQKVKIQGTTEIPDGTDVIIISVTDKYGTNQITTDSVTSGSTTIYGKDVNVDDGSFEYELNTGDLSLRAGSYKITAYWTADITVKDMTSIVLKSESIDVSVLDSTISTRDKIRVVGTTTGEPDEVRVLIVAKGIAALKNITVTDDAFEEELDSTDWEWFSPAGTTTAPTTYTPGTYEIYALHPMGGGTFDMDTDTSTNMQRLAAKGFDVFSTILGMTAIDDEVSSATSIGLQYPSLTLDATADVNTDDGLEISGATNRADGTFFILNVDGPGIDETATIEAADGAISATFDTTGWPIGSYHVTAEDIDNTVSDEASFNVVQGVPNIMVDVSVSPSSVDIGETTTVTATAENKGTASGTVSVSLTVDDEEVKAVDLEVAAGATESFTYTYTAVEEGTYTIDANGATATLIVKAPVATAPPTDDTPTATPDATEDPTEPGFEGIFAVTGLLAVAYLVLRRRDN